METGKQEVKVKVMASDLLSLTSFTGVKQGPRLLVPVDQFYRQDMKTACVLFCLLVVERICWHPA